MQTKEVFIVHSRGWVGRGACKVSLSRTHGHIIMVETEDQNKRIDKTAFLLLNYFQVYLTNK